MIASIRTASPLLAKNLRNLPPALVITGEYDVARDDGKVDLCRNRLKQAGVSSNGLISGFKGMGHIRGHIWDGCAREAVQSCIRH